MTATNPLSVPKRVPFTKQQVVNQRNDQTETVNSTEWINWASNVSDILQGAATMGIVGVMVLAPFTLGASWLPANGAAVSRSSYAKLFAAVGTTFGAGDGSTTFNVPTLADPVSGLHWYMRAA